MSRLGESFWRAGARGAWEGRKRPSTGAANRSSHALPDRQGRGRRPGRRRPRSRPGAAAAPARSRGRRRRTARARPARRVAAGLRALTGRADAAYVSGTDVPLLQPAFIRRLADALGDEADAVVPRVEGRLYPLSGVYRVQLLAAAESLLAAGRLRASLLSEEARTVYLDERRPAVRPGPRRGRSGAPLARRPERRDGLRARPGRVGFARCRAPRCRPSSSRSWPDPNAAVVGDGPAGRVTGLDRDLVRVARRQRPAQHGRRGTPPPEPPARPPRGADRPRRHRSTITSRCSAASSRSATTRISRTSTGSRCATSARPTTTASTSGASVVARVDRWHTWGKAREAPEAQSRSSRSGCV